VKKIIAVTCTVFVYTHSRRRYAIASHHRLTFRLDCGHQQEIDQAIDLHHSATATRRLTATSQATSTLGTQAIGGQAVDPSNKPGVEGIDPSTNSIDNPTGTMIVNRDSPTVAHSIEAVPADSISRPISGNRDSASQGKQYIIVHQERHQHTIVPHSNTPPRAPTASTAPLSPTHCSEQARHLSHHYTLYHLSTSP
jgi:hypothetical protein